MHETSFQKLSYSAEENLNLALEGEVDVKFL